MRQRSRLLYLKREPKSDRAAFPAEDIWRSVRSKPCLPRRVLLKTSAGAWTRLASAGRATRVPPPTRRRVLYARPRSVCATRKGRKARAMVMVAN